MGGEQVSPVHEVEHLVKLEWDVADASAVLSQNEAGEPELWVATVDCKDADAKTLETFMRQRGIVGRVRLFPVKAIPRGANGKVQRERLKTLMLDVVGRSEF